MSTHREAFSDFTEFEIVSIEETDTGRAPTRIAFEYSNPAIGVDTGASFVTHDIIGGASVRQRITDKPLEVDVTGVARESTARQLAQLRNAKYGTILSDRFEDNSLTVHFPSISIQPMEDGGAAALGDDEFLYSYDLTCVEILNTANTQVADAPDPNTNDPGTISPDDI